MINQSLSQLAESKKPFLDIFAWGSRIQISQFLFTTLCVRCIPSYPKSQTCTRKKEERKRRKEGRKEKKREEKRREEKRKQERREEPAWNWFSSVENC